MWRAGGPWSPLRHDVLHDATAKLRLVADRLAEATRNSEEHELAEVILVVGAVGSGGVAGTLPTGTLRNSSAPDGCEVGEVDQRVVQRRWQGLPGVAGSPV